MVVEIIAWIAAAYVKIRNPPAPKTPARNKRPVIPSGFCQKDFCFICGASIIVVISNKRWSKIVNCTRLNKRSKKGPLFYALDQCPENIDYFRNSFI
jgi:hypothetical protein